MRFLLLTKVEDKHAKSTRSKETITHSKFKRGSFIDA